MAQRAKGGTDIPVVTFVDVVTQGIKNGRVKTDDVAQLAYLKTQFPTGKLVNGYYVLAIAKNALSGYDGLEELVDQIFASPELKENTPAFLEQEDEIAIAPTADQPAEFEVLKSLKKHTDYNTLLNNASEPGVGEHIKHLSVFKKLSGNQQRTLAKCLPIGNFGIAEYVDIVAKNMVVSRVVPPGMVARDAAQYAIFLRQAQMTINIAEGVLERKA